MLGAKGSSGAKVQGRSEEAELHRGDQASRRAGVQVGEIKGNGDRVPRTPKCAEANQVKGASSIVEKNADGIKVNGANRTQNKNGNANQIGARRARNARLDRDGQHAEANANLKRKPKLRPKSRAVRPRARKKDLLGARPRGRENLKPLPEVNDELHGPAGQERRGRRRPNRSQLPRFSKASVVGEAGSVAVASGPKSGSPLRLSHLCFDEKGARLMAQNYRVGDELNHRWEVIIVGGGLAGLSGAIYLGRARRKTLLIDSGKSLALWEPHVENYLGFPDSIPGEELLRLGRQQAEKYEIRFVQETISEAVKQEDYFSVRGEKDYYECRRLLLATGLYHLPPDVPGVNECLGHSMFFCKDCDAYRVQDQRVAIIGRNNDAVEYALAILAYSPCVVIATNGREHKWDETHAAWLREYEIPVYPERILEIEHEDGKLRSVSFQDGVSVAVDSAFTTRGDVYHNDLARALGAETDEAGQIIVNESLATSVPGLYAAGCVTPANCQMIIAAGQGAAAAQAINRDLFEESLKTHSLRRFRAVQLQTEQTTPEMLQGKQG